MKASSRSCFTSKAKFNVANDLSTSLRLTDFGNEGVIFQTGYEMFSYTFDSEISCRVSVLMKKFDCSCNGVAAAVSAIEAHCAQFRNSCKLFGNLPSGLCLLYVQDTSYPIKNCKFQ